MPIILDKRKILDRTTLFKKIKLVNFINYEVRKMLDKEENFIEFVVFYKKNDVKFSYEKFNRTILEFLNNRTNESNFESDNSNKIEKTYGYSDNGLDQIETKEILKNQFERNVKYVSRMKKLLNDDEKHYMRKNLRLILPKATFRNKGDTIEKTINKYIKIRCMKKHSELDLNSLINNISPSSNHADDASILIKTIEELAFYKINVAVIHDSIGSCLALSSIIKLIFKKKNIEYLDFLIKNDDYFPFDRLKKPFQNYNINSLDEMQMSLEQQRQKLISEREENKKLFIDNYGVIFKEIIESLDFFN